MRRIPAAALTAFLIVALLALTGCTTWFESPAKPANAAISVANTHLQNATVAGSAVTSSAAALAAVPYDMGGFASAIQLTAQIEKDLVTQKAELGSAKAAIDSITAMDVSPELKAYASLESTAIATRVKVVDLNTDLYSQMNMLFTARSKGAKTVEYQPILARIDEIKTELGTVSQQAAQQAQAASDYFTSKKLGG
jgi:hypothetical protein